MALRPETQAKPVVPSKKNIIRGAYPLAQDLMLFSAGTPSQDMKEFPGLDCVTSGSRCGG